MTGTILCASCGKLMPAEEEGLDHICDECLCEDEPSADHVVVDTNDDGAFKCLNCGARYLMNVPCPLSVYAVAAREFAHIHKDCKK